VANSDANILSNLILRLNYTENTNSGANTSTISWSLQIICTSGSAFNNNNNVWHAYVNGSLVGQGNSKYNLSSGQSITLGSGTSGAIAHNANGSKTISVSGDYDDATVITASNGAFALTDYAVAPSAPAAPSLGNRNSTGTSVSVTSAVPSSASTITDYNYQFSTNNSSWSADQAMGTGRVATFGSMTKAQTYYFRTRAYADGAWSAYGASTASLGFPAAPTGFSATSSTSVSNRISLAWSAVATTNGAITGYDIYEYNTSSGVSRLVKTVAGSVTSYNTDNAPLITFTVGTVYTFYVRSRNASADNSGGQSDNSSTTAAMAPGLPSAPTSMTATPDTTQPRIVLSWTAPSVTAGGITGYTISYKETSGGTYATLATLTGTATTYNADYLQSGVNYTFKSQARNSFADTNSTAGPASNEPSALAPGTPTKPLNLVATVSPTVYGRISLAWDTPSDTAGGITGYNIFTVSGGVYTQLAAISGTATTYVANGLTANQTYNFSIKARNLYSDNTGTLSDPSDPPVTATAAGPPSAPRNLVATADTQNAGVITLNWDAPLETAGGLTGYNVFYTDGTLVASLNATTVTFDASGLTGGTTYYFYIRARNQITDANDPNLGGPQSNTAFASAVGAPEVPPNFTITASTTVAGRLTLSWGSATDAQSYNIFTGGSTGVFYGRTAGLTFVIDNLVGNTSYSFKVQGVNAITPNGGDFTATVSATTNNASTISVNSLSVVNKTNDAIDGSVTISAIPTTDKFRYTKTAPNYAAATVPAVTNSLVNSTNVVFNTGSPFTITTVGPKTSVFTYSNTGSTITSIAASGTTFNNTNQLFNGTGITVTATNGSTGAMSYARPGASNISEREVSGTITNTSNTSFNGTDLILTAVTANTFDYARPGIADLDDTASSGLVTNNTNIDIFNGPYQISTTPEYNTLTYTPTPATSYNVNASIPSLYSTLKRSISKATLKVIYRPGSIG
jgi:hypothetical protein